MVKFDFKPIDSDKKFEKYEKFEIKNNNGEITLTIYDEGRDFYWLMKPNGEGLDTQKTHISNLLLKFFDEHF